jgi:ribonuclease P protein component
LIARVRQRQTFQRLTREGVRIRRSTLWCTWCPQSDSTPATGPEVAFAIGRAVGPAVTRNRLRRRLRAILAELDSVEPLPPITMLLGATPTATKLTFDQLHSELRQLLDRIRLAGTPPGS